LVLCTGNSARSILGEVLINTLGQGRFLAVSAGSHPVGQVNPGAVAVLRDAGYETRGLESKSWDQFAGSDALPIDIVITVCDNAAGETCPVWSGSPVTVHWGIDDPAAAEAAKQPQAFAAACDALTRRIAAMLEVPLESLDPRMRREALQRIHESACVAEAVKD
jgi:arsenate reductase